MLVSAVLWIVRPQVPDQDKAQVKWEDLFQFVKFFQLAGLLSHLTQRSSPGM